MFWKYNHTSSTHIDILLNREDVTLQELMDEEDVLQECKCQNKKLIDFLVRPEIMEELVRLTTSEPPVDLDEKKRYKYPNIACELLTCDVPSLNERLAGDDELLGKLYTFLETETPLNPLLASFFSKTFGVLVSRSSEQNWYSYQFTCLQVLEFLKSKENFITLLLKHLGTSAIMDLLLKLITHIEGAELKQNILGWLDSQQVIQNLIGLLDPSVDGERNCNASQLLCDVIKMSRDNQHTALEKTELDPILSRVEDSETVSLLLDHILGAEKHESSIVGGIMVLLTLLDCSRPANEPNAASTDQNNMYCGEGQAEEPHIAADSEEAAKVTLTTLEAILPRLKDFHNLLLDPPNKQSVKTTVGVLDPPLGNTRIHIAKLLATVIASNHPHINKELAELGTVETLLDLFFKYSWNNFLHSQVEQCLAFALNVDVTGTEGSDEVTENNVLLKNIFIKCRLLQRILEAWEDNETQQSKCGGLRRGYMGHLIKIANIVAAQVEKGLLGTFIKEHVPSDTVVAWEEFLVNILVETNKTHSISLGGAHPVLSGSEDDDFDYRDIPFPPNTAFQEAFSDYQMQQLAPQFIENYGFHDEEFTDSDDMLHTSVDRLTNMTFSLSEAEFDKQAEMFKKACAQKMHTQEDGAEDLWDDQEVTFPAVTARASVWEESGDNEAANSSDEDEREGPEGREEIHMEVDSTDPWTAGELVSPGAIAIVAEDSGNPWTSVSETAATNDQVIPEQSGWADFGSGGFADFEANFTSSPKLSASEDKLKDANISSKTADASLPEPAEKPVVGEPDAIQSVPTSDDNANPRNVSAVVQLVDNHRFLQSQESPVSGVPGGSGEPSSSETLVVTDDSSLPNPASDSTLAESKPQQTPPKNLTPEDSPSPSKVLTPNGPI